MGSSRRQRHNMMVCKNRFESDEREVRRKLTRCMVLLSNFHIIEKFALNISSGSFLIQQSQKTSITSFLAEVPNV